MSVKASSAVLRVLNLQLQPAELGVVTIRMRLAGESLEMELHVEREETAQLLRNDSEKLSALLRGSGYRPDSINIQVGDAAAQDRAAAHRQSSDFGSQSQSFHQSQAGQDGGHGHRDGQHANERAEVRSNASESSTVRSHNPDSVYL